MEKSTLTEMYKKWNPILNRWLGLSAVISLIFLSFIDKTEIFNKYETTVALYILLICLKVLFDIHESIMGTVGGKNCDESYDDFQALSKDLKEDIVKNLKKKKKLNIKIMGVSAHYSWPYIQDNILINCHENLCQNSSIHIEIAIADNEYLKKMKVGKWRYYSEQTTKGIEAFEKKHSHLIENGTVKIDLYHYTNIPHWHGLLINEECLYLGNADWMMNSEKEIFDLTVGTNRYKKYNARDEIERAKQKVFNNWFEYYKMISLEKNTSQVTSS